MERDSGICNRLSPFQKVTTEPAVVILLVSSYLVTTASSHG